MMDPKLAAILKKAKVLDQAAKKYDTNPNGSSKSVSPSMTEQMGGSSQSMNSSTGLYDQMGVSGGMNTPTMDVNSPTYSQNVENSKLPAAIKEAMKNNPIPQPDMIGGIDSEMVNEIRNAGRPQIEEPTLDYSDDDEKEMDFSMTPTRKPQMMSENTVTNAGSIRQMIAEEIAKALPSVIEEYFDKRVLKENVQFKAGNTTFSGTVSPLPKKRTKKRG